MKCHTKLIFLDGEVFEGNTPKEIVKQIQQRGFWGKYKTLNEYVSKLAKRVVWVEGKAIRVEGKTIQERCESLVNQLVEKGIARKES